MRKDPRPGKAPAAALALMVLVLAVAGVGCPCVRGPVNASPALRWWLFSNFGANKICPEMLKRGVGLRLPGMPQSTPTIGRFFPNSCLAEVSNTGPFVTVDFSGTGYAYLGTGLALNPFRGRVSFACSAKVEYSSDFVLGDDEIYVWAKYNRVVSGPRFDVVSLDTPLGQVPPAAAVVLDMLTSSIGPAIVAGELTRGFTVVQDWDTESNSFALGVVVPPHRPFTPYDVSKDARYTFANEEIELQGGQRDFLGPFEILEVGQKLELRYFLQSAAAVDVMVVTRATGDFWRDGYQRDLPLGPPPGPVLAGAPLVPGREQLASYQLPPGQYYVVVDNTAYAGSVAPPPPSLLDPLGGGAARLKYVAQLGER